MNPATVLRRRAAVALAIAVIGVVAGIPSLPGAGTPSGLARSVSAALESSGVVPIPTHATPTEVAPAFDPVDGAVEVGELPAAVPLSVAVGLVSRDPSGLSAWVNASGVPGTPEFQHPLTPSEAADRFGATTASVRAAEQYFDGYGLATSVAPDGLLVYVTGASGGVARAFGTTFDLYRLADGRTVYGHPTPAVLPPVAPWSGALGLGNLTSVVPASTVATADGPIAPSAGCGSGADGLLPCNIENAYNITPLIDNGTDGAGERIAVVDAYSGDEPEDQLKSDLSAFVSRIGIPLGTVDYLYPVPSVRSLNSSSTNPLWDLEDALDLEWSRAIAPGATIEMTFSPNPGPGLYAAVNWLVARGAADVISLSWGEPDVGVFNAYSGPCSAGCNASTDGSYAILAPVLELAAAEGITVFAASGDCGAADGTSGLSTNYPASDPYVTGVGGTVLSLTDGKYGSETGWSGSASGATAPGCENQGGSGGGYSPFPRPWWQTGLPAGRTQRGVPDVAMDADTPVQIEFEGGTSTVIGTSVGTPIWAAIAAIADQHAGVDLGFLNPSLYRILGSDRYATDFHDITSGNNTYAAGVGWDPVTGIGTPIVNQLVVNLAAGGAAPGEGLVTFVSASTTSGPAPLTVTFTLSVSGGTGTYPLEGVSFGDTNSSETHTGTVRYTYDTPGVYHAQSFVVDSSGNESVSPPLPIVVGGGSALDVTLELSNDAPAVGGDVTYTAEVTGGTAPYRYDFWFGDGASVNGTTDASVTYAYPSEGLYCAVAVVSDSADPVDAGTSAVLEVAVGGATGTICGGTLTPLTVTPSSASTTRDAPADFPDLFTVAGGPTGNGIPPPTVSLSSTDPYVAACDCAILRAAGTYTVVETASDSVGQRANASVEVTVTPALVGQFTASTDAGRVPLEVNFSATVSGGYRANASTTVWTIGDSGTTETGANVSWTFTTPGEYLVTGRTGDAGFGNTSRAFLIDAEPASGSPPVGVTGTFAPAASIEAGTTVEFSAAVIGGAPSDRIFWALGATATAVGPTANETFFAPPTDDELDVGISVAGSDWSPVESVSAVLHDFLAVEAAGFVPAADALEEGVTLTPDVGLVPLEVRGTVAASAPGTVSIVTQLGDGATVDGTSIAYRYLEPGNYTVTTTTQDLPYGDTAVVSNREVVAPEFRFRGGPSPGSGVAPLRVDFDVRVSGGGEPPYDYAWTFGNGVSSAGAEPSANYTRPGSYAVALRVVDQFGDVAEMNWTVSVELSPLVPIAIVTIGAGVGVALAVVLGGAGHRRRRPPATP